MKIFYAILLFFALALGIGNLFYIKKAFAEKRRNSWRNV